MVQRWGLLALVAVAIALVAQFLLPSEPVRLPEPVPFPFSAPVSATLQNDQYSFGRYRSPFEVVNFAPRLTGSNPLETFLNSAKAFVQWKRWHFSSVIIPGQIFISFAIVHLNYVGNAFAYAVDLSTSPPTKFESSMLSPLGMAVTSFANSSLTGCSQWEQTNFNLKACYLPKTKQYELTLNVLLGPEQKPLRGTFLMDTQSSEGLDLLTESVALLHKANGDPSRPIYTHKLAGMPVSCSSVVFGTKSLSCSADTQGVLDWTSGFPPRVTTWHWASFAGRSKNGSKIAINLSNLIYNNSYGASEENAVWVDGRVYPTDSATFSVPKEPAKAPWKITTADQRSGVILTLNFVPKGVRGEDVNFGVASSKFVQPFGVFSGTVQLTGSDSIEFDDVFGVVEEHFAKW